MVTANPNPLSEIAPTSTEPHTSVLVFLPAMPAEQVEAVLVNLANSFEVGDLLIAAPEGSANDAHPNLRTVIAPPSKAAVTLTASDFVNAYQLAEKNNARAVLMLGQECSSLDSSALRKLADSVLEGQSDLAIPCYDLPPRAGLVNSAILYPLTRALFASRTRFPLAIDLGLSLRMSERMAAAGQRFTSLNDGESPLWPVNEAVVAGFTITEVDVGTRTLPQPTDPDINAILASVTGSLFADFDAKAAFWQRARQFPRARNPVSNAQSIDPHVVIGPMLDAFQLAYTNLQEIWSLVLPPNSLLGVKRLSQVSATNFRMPDSLWARIVFDFLLAYRVRTINRGHLLGALIPLYLAWVASHFNITASGTDAERHIEAVAAAFEADKPYLVARWRWPDRFNP